MRSQSLILYWLFNFSHVPGFLPTSQISHVNLIDSLNGWSSLASSSIYLTHSQQIIRIFQELDMFQVSALETHLRERGRKERGEGGVKEHERLWSGVVRRDLCTSEIISEKIRLRMPSWRITFKYPFLCIFHVLKLAIFDDINKATLWQKDTLQL